MPQSASFFFVVFLERSECALFNSLSVRLGKSAVMPPMASAPRLWQISGNNSRKFWKNGTCAESCCDREAPIQDLQG